MRGRRKKTKVAYHRERWYNIDMTDFGKGPTLAEANPWLRDEAERIERILDVTERDSVIEGLPPFSEGTRERLRKELTAGSRPGQAPANDLDHRGIVSLERSFRRLDVLALPFVALVVDQKRPSRLRSK